MWILVRLVIGIAILTIVEIYFLRKSGHAIQIMFPSFFSGKYKIVKRIFIFWLNLYPLVLIAVYVYFATSGQYISAPDSFLYNYLLVYPFWVLFLLMTQASVYFLIIDLIKLFLYPFYRKRKEKLLKLQAKIVFVIITFFLIYIPARVIYDYYSVSVRSTELTRNNLPESLANFRIAFVADIQADRYTDVSRLRNFVEAVNETNPDLVLIAGDLITTGPDYIETIGNVLGKLESKYGVFSCVGDHDNWAYRNDYSRSIADITTSLSKNNVQMVDNDKRRININKSAIEITFVTNTYAGRVSKIILDSLSSNGSGDLKIFLTHQPRNYLINSALENNFDLFLAGHTHGGQLTLLFPFIQLTPTLIETNYIKGDYWFGKSNVEDQSKDMLAIITGGLGMSLAPIRYNSTPEVTVITLRKFR